ncbi:hypothetical protein ETAA8_32690 [Anatilimnocola aggregata]|uniref:LTXXQ motif family protein n=1 Tax=Anatilimnocola aggregata TaxID=2528021 RepID=A0A517YDB1_9BACT|nr:hypothetical protein [Anatilimnocola aggregata]QDU28169.1 hypothetical protein ETAA8_32690 [Anatilimnocola aggregata]
MLKYLPALILPILAIFALPTAGSAHWGHHHRHHYYYAYPVAPVVYQFVNPTPPADSGGGGDGGGDGGAGFGSPDAASLRAAYKADVAEAADDMLKADKSHQAALLKMKRIQKDIMKMRVSLANSQNAPVPAPKIPPQPSTEMKAIQQLGTKLDGFMTANKSDLDAIKDRLNQLENPKPAKAAAPSVKK